jgi:catechol 2,3-dioxygenase-like lactoylglutathione lyase family enzyme
VTEGALPVRHVLVILACGDVARSRAFYLGVFGWKVVVDLPVYVEMVVPTGLRVGLYRREGFAANTGEPPSPAPAEGTTATELYLRVDDVPAALARLLANGARLLSAPSPRPWGDEAAYVADPDGNVVAVSRPLGE